MMSVMARPERVLVDEAAGLVGSALVDHPHAEGREITAFDSFDPFDTEEEKRRNLRGAMPQSQFRLVRCDVWDAEPVATLFDEGRFEDIVHLAALARVE